MKRIVKTIPGAKSVIKLWQSIADNILDYLLNKFPGWEYNSKKKRWINNWYRHNFSPSWMITRIPQEIQDAVDSGWFPPDSFLLDIGCGSGEIAAWLATKNFKVLGIDYAISAIEKAKSEHKEIPGKLEFKTFDICRDSFGETRLRFNALVDRGCFHTIPKAFHLDYVNGVSSCSCAGAHFLLLCKFTKTWFKFSNKDQLKEKMTAYLKQLFQTRFEIVKMEPIFLERRGANMPGLAIWMIRQ